MRREEREKKLLEDKVKKVNRAKQRSEKFAQETERMERIHNIEDFTIVQETLHNSEIGPLVLSDVLVPIQELECDTTCMSQMERTDCRVIVQEAREERDEALRLAQHFRNIAEQTASQKQHLHCEFLSRVETVRDFWRNMIVEGGSRSGIIKSFTSEKMINNYNWCRFEY